MTSAGALNMARSIRSSPTSPSQTICGTYEYMPPEIVNEQPHDKEVDIWAIGVLLYELIHGSH